MITKEQAVYVASLLKEYLGDYSECIDVGDDFVEKRSKDILKRGYYTDLEQSIVEHQHSATFGCDCEEFEEAA